jgi:protein O-GlcNAc transferase
VIKIKRKNTKKVEDILQLALMCHKKGILEQAKVLYEKILKENPNFDIVCNNLGYICLKQGCPDEAMSYFQRAIQLNPSLALANNNLGIILQERGQTDGAISYYRKAIELDPNCSEAFNNLGNIFQRQDRLKDASESYRKALDLNPNLPEAYNNLGIVLSDMGEYDEAIACCQKALKIYPGLADIHNNLGNALRKKMKLEEAVTCYRKASQLNPKHAYVSYNLGNALSQCGKSDEAVSAFDRALQSKRDFFRAKLARCMCRLQIIYPDEPDIRNARHCYCDDLTKLKDSFSAEIPQDIAEAAKAVGSHQPFYLACQAMNDRDLQKVYGDLICRIMASRFPEFSGRPSMPPVSSGERLRIGFVSGFFRLHSNWKVPISGWVENLDRDRFGLYGYYTGKKKDSETERSRNSFHRFVEDVHSFEGLCRTIRNDDLHVLVYPEIGMNPAALRLASVRLAPVQCVSWGHPDTSGLKTVDYYLSSDLMEPPDADVHYTEQLVRLPNLSVYYTPRDVKSAEICRDTLGLSAKSTLYLCCQTLQKYLPQYDDIYPRIARGAGDCRFLFISHPESRSVTEQFSRRMGRAFSRAGLNSEDYLVFLPHLDPEHYVAVNSLSDVFLDTIGWSGCNSTFEAIAHNLPVVTLPGRLMRGRHSSAILGMMGINETIADTIDDYVALSVRLGRDTNWRKRISEKVAAAKHLVYRDRTCISALEDFFEKVVRQHGVRQGTSQAERQYLSAAQRTY